jgi:hypothetical protein
MYTTNPWVRLDRAIAIIRAQARKVPTVSGNARVIASWPAKQAPRPIGRSFTGPVQSYRVW